MVSESFLHYLWQHRVFSTQELRTTSQQALHIYKPGSLNTDAGPDFFNSRIRIADQEWVGNIEIHIRSSDWYHHKHQHDENYQNVILHVVWIHDKEVGLNQEKLATLELRNIVAKHTISSYKKLFFKPSKYVHCESMIHQVDSFTMKHWAESLFFERMNDKADKVQKLLDASSNDWERVLFQLLAKGFGMKVNGEAFLALAKSLPFKLILKESMNLFRLEAVFFGQAGFLTDKLSIPYHKEMRREYFFLKSKYNLEPLFKGQFKFFRLRPNNFPTVRLAQLAMLYHQHQNLFKKILNNQKPAYFYKLLKMGTSPFWQSHYTFNSLTRKSTKKLSSSFVDLLLINVILPFRFLYYRQLGKVEAAEILMLATGFKPEKNSIISGFSKMNIRIESLFESQSFIQLKLNYCQHHRCLQCEIGSSLLKRNKIES